MWENAVNLLSATGLLLLAWPALAANAAARRLSRIQQLSVGAATDEFFRKTQTMLRENAEAGLGWKRHHSALLFCGWGLSALAGVVKLFTDWQ